MDWMQIVTLILALLAAVLVYRRLGTGRRLRRAGVGLLGASETQQLISEQKAIVLDVREDREYRSGRIPRARHIPLRQMSYRLKELERYRDRPIVVSCRSGNRSANACLLLSRNGFSKVYNLQGGIIAWRQANLKVER